MWFWLTQCCSKSCRRTTTSDVARYRRRRYAICSEVAATRNSASYSSRTQPPSPVSARTLHQSVLPRRCPAPTSIATADSWGHTAISMPNQSDLPFSLVLVRQLSVIRMLSFFVNSIRGVFNK